LNYRVAPLARRNGLGSGRGEKHGQAGRGLISRFLCADPAERVLFLVDRKEDLRVTRAWSKETNTMTLKAVMNLLVLTSELNVHADGYSVYVKGELW
jgi:hypothetical protein